MLAKIQSLVKAELESSGEDDSGRTHNLDLAAAALLLEVSAADFQNHPEERQAIHDALAKVFHLEETVIEQLMADAESAVKEATSLYEFTRVLNDNCSHSEKMFLLEQCWRVAYADGRLDKYEDHRIRHLAELMYLSHREFIQTKLKIIQ
jgi:uncharacterized tellurite resistance protein B-like protein